MKSLKLTGAIFSVAGLLAFAAPAQAAAQPQDADEAALKGTAKDGQATYVFDDDNVDGEILRPEGAQIGSRGRSRHASLITIRAHFIGELIRLANDI